MNDCKAFCFSLYHLKRGTFSCDEQVLNLVDHCFVFMKMSTQQARLYGLLWNAKYVRQCVHLKVLFVISSYNFKSNDYD